MSRSFPAPIWVLFALICLLRLVVTADLNVPPSYQPHDDSLYLLRSYFYHLGQGFGPFDPRTLVKLPGISLWISWAKTLGIPFLLSVNFLYIAASFLLFRFNLKFFSPNISLLTHFLFLFNPITLERTTFGPFRESLQLPLMAILVLSFFGILMKMKSEENYSPQLALFSLVMSFLILLREEMILLWGFPVFLVVFLALRQGRPYTRLVNKWQAVQILAIPFSFFLLTQFATLNHIESHYGVRISHDFSQGHFPKMLEALKKVKPFHPSQYVSISQKSLENVATALPEFRQIVGTLKKLYPPPHPESGLFKTYNFFKKSPGEWPDSHHFFWIKDAIYFSGLGLSAETSQSYYLHLSKKIEKLCQTKILDCAEPSPHIVKLFPSALRSFVLGIARAVFTDLPPPRTKDPFFLRPIHHLNKTETVSLGQKISQMSISPFDSRFQWHLLSKNKKISPWWKGRQDVRGALLYMHKYPEVAKNPQFGVWHSLSPTTKSFLHALPGFTEENKEQFAVQTMLQQPLLSFELSKMNYNGTEDHGSAIHHKLNSPFGHYKWPENPPAPLSTFSAKDWSTFRTSLTIFYPLLSGLILFGLLLFLAALLRERTALLTQPLQFGLAAYLVYFLVKNLALAVLAQTYGTLDARLLYSNFLVFSLLLTPLALQRMSRFIAENRAYLYLSTHRKKIIWGSAGFIFVVTLLMQPLFNGPKGNLLKTSMAILQKDKDSINELVNTESIANSLLASTSNSTAPENLSLPRSTILKAIRFLLIDRITAKNEKIDWKVIDRHLPSPLSIYQENYDKRFFEFVGIDSNYIEEKKFLLHIRFKIDGSPISLAIEQVKSADKWRVEKIHNLDQLFSSLSLLRSQN